MLATLALDPTLCALHFRSETRATRTGAETHFEQAALVIVAWLSVPARSLTAMQKKGGKKEGEKKRRRLQLLLRKRLKQTDKKK